jgi:hypothetical protein
MIVTNTTVGKAIGGKKTLLKVFSVDRIMF